MFLPRLITESGIYKLFQQVILNEPNTIFIQKANAQINSLEEIGNQTPTSVLSNSRSLERR